MLQLVTDLISIGIGITGFLFGVYQYRIRKKEEKERNLSKEVYEPVLNEVAAILNNISTLSGLTISPRVWLDGRDATSGTLLRNDDRDLFDILNVFYDLIRDFGSRFDLLRWKRNKRGLVPGETINTQEDENLLLHLLHNRIMPLGDRISKKLKKKIRI